MSREPRMADSGNAAASGAVGLMSVLIGIMACLLAMFMLSVGLKPLVLLMAGGGVVALAFISGQPKAVLLFSWVFAITYNRHIYSFDNILGDFGSQGLYWTPSDALLFLLYAIWFFEAAILKKPQQPQGKPVWPWVMPFLFACGISALAAVHIQWGVFEVIRLSKVGLVLLYFRYNVGKVEWWSIVAGLGTAVVFQSVLGADQAVFNLLQSALRHAGLGGNVAESEETAFRARGTMGHPNILGPWLIMIVPAFLALGLASKKWWLSILALGVAVLGFGGIVLTKSRMPIAVVLMDSAILLAALVWLRMLTVNRAIALAAFGAMLAAVGGLAILDKIVDRLTSDLQRSVEFREQYNDIAISIWEENPILGIGLNNFSEGLRKRAPTLARINDKLEKDLRKQYNLRTFAPVHNMYLLILSEIGVVGLFAFFYFYLGVMLRGLSAVARSDTLASSFCVGLTIGLFGQLFQQTIDFSLWYDVGMITIGIIFGLVTLAPALMPASEDVESRETYAVVGGQVREVGS
ncbi:MAG: hypothetical protein CMM50_17810 [Rhodospirillaceae bacterium]|nr:hypothetical protein [Rhodospirillaceae bacterium]